MNNSNKNVYSTYSKHSARILEGGLSQGYSRNTRRSFSRTFGRYFEALNPGSLVLDVGCGTGRFLDWLQQFQEIKTIGVDISESQLSVARSLNPKSTFLLKDGTEYLQENSGKFYAVTCLDVLEHLPSTDALLEFLGAIHDSLIGGGFVLCSVPNAANLTSTYVRYADITHHRLFTTTSLLQLFESTGFSRISVLPSVPGHFGGRIRRLAMNLLHRMLFRICGRGYERNFDPNIFLIGFKDGNAIKTE